MQIVEVFKDGYASDNKGRLELADGADVDAAVFKAFGSFARAFRITQNPTLDPDAPWTIYAPKPHEIEAAKWAHAKGVYADVLAEIEDGYQTASLTVAEAGRYWQHCEFTQERLNAIRRDIEGAYRRLNSAWVEAVRKAWGPDNT